MRPRNTIIALVVLLIIGGYAFVMNRYSRPIPAEKLLGIKADDFAKIELKYPDRVLDRRAAQGRTVADRQADRRGRGTDPGRQSRTRDRQR